MKTVTACPNTIDHSPTLQSQPESVIDSQHADYHNYLTDWSIAAIFGTVSGMVSNEIRN